MTKDPNFQFTSCPKKRKSHKQTARSSLCAANPNLVLTTPTEEATPILHSHKAKPDKINDKHGSSLPSINECFGLLCYTFRQKALLRNSSLSPRRFLTGVAMEYVLRYVSASPSGTASTFDLVSPRFPRLLLHGSFKSDAVWIRF